MNTTADLDLRLVAAANAAASALWSPAPLEPAEPVPAASATGLVPPDGTGFIATFTGTSHGTVLLVVNGEMTATLQESSIGALSLADAARGVIEAAASSAGPVVLDAVTRVDGLSALVEHPELVAFAMTAGGAVHAVLALSMSEPSEQRAAAPGAAARGVAAGGPGSAAAAAAGGRAAYDLLLDVEMDVTAELGRTRMTVRALLDLEPGSIVELDRMAGSPVDLLVNGRLIARGEVVVVDEEFALRVTEIVASAVEAER